MYLMGIGENKKEILKAYQALVWEGIDVQLVDDSRELLDKTINNEVDGAIRGSLSSSEIMPLLKKEIGEFYRASILKNPFTDDIFLLCPVGIDEVNNIQDKINIINYSINFLKSKNIVPKVGLLSAGRLSDYGRSEKIDNSLNECENIIKYFKKIYNNEDSENDNILETEDGIIIHHNGILIEEYLKNGYNIIIAPDGISGNLIFRCLGLVCKMEGYGAVILNDKDIKFIDTSRSGDWKRYYNAIKFLNGD
ncbi:methanogenesis marker protein Mmp4/MtxX [Methanococcus aeolicus]|uniref:Methlytransferase n=1 Tax=Methanococcus aeolicus (strain ATCC BAA-1280 / DSM 17508 / OCM 812 / Nankai-3) TaxID=419665 RepID=A6UW42_META3|nr:methanogenesis marker protein Mmp4/MtxX [Methanococcus aeolicus]ABR56714.1 methlytransferase [Methanococcus aeolicus Nankai-3]UXM84716.1 methanogenesis marker protein Mmp4/MtxX [Methanococcus aeolicus]